MSKFNRTGAETQASDNNSVWKSFWACFSGTWIESHEHSDVIAELGELCRQESWNIATWDIAIWDIDQGLRSAAGVPPETEATPIVPTTDTIPVAERLQAETTAVRLRIRSLLAESNASSGIILNNTSLHTITGNTFFNLVSKALELKGEPSRHNIVSNNRLVNVLSDYEKLVALKTQRNLVTSSDENQNE